MSVRVSILVPIYGVEKYVERCADSLFRQSYPNIEYVFVNDCTKDASIVILNKVIDNYPERKKDVIIIEHDVNKGLGAARNTAVTNATGEFLMHVDSDDYLDIDCVKACVEEQERKQSDIVTIDAIVHRNSYDEKRILPDYETPNDLTIALLRRDIPVNVWGRLVRMSLYKDNKLQVEKGVNMSEDWNVIPRLVSYAEKISQIHNVYYHYECRNLQSYTSSYSSNKFEQVWKTIDVLSDFFSQNTHYIEALNYGIMKAISIQVMSIAEARCFKAEFKKIKKKQLQYDMKYASHLDKGTQMALRINNYEILKLYIRVGSRIKQFYKKIRFSI